MDKRRLVKSGASSFNVAVPIEWVRKNKLEKGSEVSIDENEKGELIVGVSRETSAFQQNHFTLRITPENSNLLYWEILRAYLKNYTTISIEGENVSSVANHVLQKLNAFIGLDIIEQTKNVIVLKNFSAQDTETSPYVLFKKIDVGFRAMVDMIKIFFSKGFYHDSVLELQSQHEYNERMYLFTLKIINNILDNPSLMRIFKTDYRQLMKEHSIINALRQFSFYLNEIGKLLLLIKHGTKESSILHDMFDDLYKKYRTIITLPKSPLSKDIIELLNESKEQVAQWESHMRELKSQPLLELFVYGFNINNVLDQLGLELMN